MQKVRLILVLALAAALLLAACGPAAPNSGDATGGNSGALPTDAAGAAPTEAAAGGEEVPQTGACDAQTLIAAGEGLYTEQCAGCHGAQGEGSDEFPSLAGGDITTADALTLVQKYLSVEAHPKTLTPDDLSAVLTFVRGSFGNTGEAICADVIQQVLPVQ
jgi:mono/diheme cytochrome c family protein